MAKKTEQQASTSLNAGDLRVILSDQIRDLREGKATAQNVNALCNAVGKIISTVKLELEYAKLVGVTPRVDFLALDHKS